MLFAEASSFAEYGLIGLVLSAVFTAIGWAGIQLLGKTGILREATSAIAANAEAVKFESQARNLDSGSIKNVADAQKTVAETEEIRSAIQDNRARTLSDIRTAWHWHGGLDGFDGIFVPSLRSGNRG